jgi:hypothetical protein
MKEWCFNAMGVSTGHTLWRRSLHLVIGEGFSNFFLTVWQSEKFRTLSQMGAISPQIRQFWARPRECFRDKARAACFMWGLEVWLAWRRTNGSCFVALACRRMTNLSFAVTLKGGELCDVSLGGVIGAERCLALAQALLLMIWAHYIDACPWRRRLPPRFKVIKCLVFAFFYFLFVTQLLQNGLFSGL